MIIISNLSSYTFNVLINNFNRYRELDEGNNNDDEHIMYENTDHFFFLTCDAHLKTEKRLYL